MGLRRSRGTRTAVAVELVVSSPTLGVISDPYFLRSGSQQRKSRAEIVEETRDKENFAPLGISRSGQSSAASRGGLQIAKCPKIDAPADNGNVVLSCSELQDGQPALGLVTSRATKGSRGSEQTKKKRSSTTVKRSKNKRSCIRSGHSEDEAQHAAVSGQNAPVDIIIVNDEKDPFDGPCSPQTRNAACEDVTLSRETENHEYKEHARQQQVEERLSQGTEGPTNAVEPSSETNALAELQSAYDKLYKKFQRLKMKKYDDVEALYEDQNVRMSAYVKAAEALVDYLKRENSSLKLQLQEGDMSEILNRSRLLEKVNAEFRNDLVVERAKNLELRQEVKRLEGLILERNRDLRKNTGKIANPDKNMPQNCCSDKSNPIKRLDIAQSASPNKITDPCMLDNCTERHFRADIHCSNAAPWHQSSELLKQVNDAKCCRVESEREDDVANPGLTGACTTKVSYGSMEPAVSERNLSEVGACLVEGSTTPRKQIRNINFDLYGQPSIQLVLNAVQMMSNSLMNALPSMLMHPSMTIVCSCKISVDSPFGNQTAAQSEQLCTTQNARVEPELHTLSFAVKKRDERIQILKNEANLLQQLLEHLLGLKLTISTKGSAQLKFLHEPTGFSFRLMSTSDKYIANIFEGGELLYQTVSLGTLQKKALDWMRESDVIFAIAQVHIFFKRMLRAAYGGSNYRFFLET